MKFDIKKVKFEHNIGLKEKKMRNTIGFIAIFISVFLANIFLLVVGTILISTAYSGWCPAYSGMGKSTLEKQSPG
ncbi:MAG: DUF2892 domain-containing protein [Methylococcales bacterium]